VLSGQKSQVPQLTSLQHISSLWKATHILQ
jgi:hypothetical protein